jgi:hypothetical protein
MAAVLAADGRDSSPTRSHHSAGYCAAVVASRTAVAVCLRKPLKLRWKSRAAAIAAGAVAAVGAVAVVVLSVAVVGRRCLHWSALVDATWRLGGA